MIEAFAFTLIFACVIFTAFCGFRVVRLLRAYLHEVQRRAFWCQTVGHSINRGCLVEDAARNADAALHEFYDKRFPGSERKEERQSK